jgi:uncharacterized integral membrane protein
MCSRVVKALQSILSTNTDLTTNIDTETNSSEVEKSKNLDEQNFNGHRTSKDNMEGSLCTRCNFLYVSLIVAVNILIPLFVFIVLNDCNVQLLTIFVQAIVNICLCCVWNFTCFVEDMISLNNLDECDILENVINLTNVHEHNDVMVTIKVQEFRSRHAKYVYYNNIRLVLYVNVMAFKVIGNRAEYQLKC